MMWFKKKKDQKIEKLEATIKNQETAIVNIANSLSGFLNNAPQYSGYPKALVDVGYAVGLGYHDLRSMYKRSDAAKVIVDLHPKLGWSIYPTIKDVTADDEDVELSQILRQSSFNSYALRADKMSRIGRYSVICVIGGDLASEVQKSDYAKGFYLRVYNQSEVSVSENYGSNKEEKAGHPKIYSISPTGTALTTGGNFRIHESRVIHICQSPLESSFECDSVIENSWVELSELIRFQGSLGHGKFRTSRPKIAVEWADDVQINGPDEIKFNAEAEKFVTERREFLSLRGGTVKGINQSVSGQSKQDYESLVSTLAAAHDIPPRYFGLNSANVGADADRSSLDGVIAARRSDLQTSIVKRFIDILSDGGAIPQRVRDISWEPRPPINQSEQAEISSKKSIAYERLAKTIIEIGEAEVDLDVIYGECGLANPHKSQ